MVSPRQTKRGNLPESCSLATCDSNMQVSCRTVLAKGVTAQGIYFFTDYTSQKSAQIAQNAKVALTFHWKTTEVQIRFQGMSCKLPDSIIDEYFSYTTNRQSNCSKLVPSKQCHRQLRRICKAQPETS